MNQVQRISFINGLTPTARRLLTGIHYELQKEENQPLTVGGTPAIYKQAVNNMQTVRLQLLEELKRDPDYNVKEVIESLAYAGYDFSSANHDTRYNNRAEVTDHILAIQSLKALAEINTPESLKKLYLCLVDEEIDSGVRASVINHLSDLGKQNLRVLDMLTTIYEFYENNPGADQDSRTLSRYLLDSIELIEES